LAKVLQKLNIQQGMFNYEVKSKRFATEEKEEKRVIREKQKKRKGKGKSKRLNH